MEEPCSKKRKLIAEETESLKKSEGCAAATSSTAKAQGKAQRGACFGFEFGVPSGLWPLSCGACFVIDLDKSNLHPACKEPEKPPSAKRRRSGLTLFYRETNFHASEPFSPVLRITYCCMNPGHLSARNCLQASPSRHACRLLRENLLPAT